MPRLLDEQVGLGLASTLYSLVHGSVNARHLTRPAVAATIDLLSLSVQRTTQQAQPGDKAASGGAPVSLSTTKKRPRGSTGLVRSGKMRKRSRLLQGGAVATGAATTKAGSNGQSSAAPISLQVDARLQEVVDAAVFAGVRTPWMVRF